MDIHLAGSRPTRRAPKESFTGTVLQDPIITPQAPSRLVANRVAFEPVSTSGLRLEITMQPNWSAGIQQWRVK